MTPEQRLDRLERLAMLFGGEGLQVRKNVRMQRESLREQHEKINMLIDAQIKNEALFNDRFERNEERFARNEERFARNEERFERLVAAQMRTDEKLQALIDAIRGKNLGESFA